MGGRSVAFATIVLAASAMLLGGCTAPWGTAEPAVNAEPGVTCIEGPLKDSTTESTLTFGGSGQEWPDMRSDTTIEVPEGWPNAADLLTHATWPQFHAAVACLLRDSEGFHAGPPNTSLVTKDGQTFVNVHESVEYRGFGTDCGWPLGQWDLHYATRAEQYEFLFTSPGFRERCGAPIRTLPDPTLPRVALDPGDILAAFRTARTHSPGEPAPPYPHLLPAPSPALTALLAFADTEAETTVQKTVTLHLDATGADVVRAQRPATSGDDGHTMTWTISPGEKDDVFWLVLRPRGQVAAQLFAIHSSYAWVQPASQWLGWAVLVVLTLIGCVRARRSLRAQSVATGVQGTVALDAKRSLLDVAVLAVVILLAAAGRGVGDGWYAMDPRLTPADAWYRLEAALLVVLTAVVGARFAIGSWLRRVFSALLALVAVVFVPPQPTALGFLSRYVHVPGDTSRADTWLGLVAVAVVAVLVTVTVLWLVRMTHVWRRPRPTGRVRRVVVALAVGVIVSLVMLAQQSYDSFLDADRRVVTPRGLRLDNLQTDRVLGGYGWLPDWLLGLTPALLSYALLVAILVALRRLHDADPGASADGRAARWLVLALLAGWLAYTDGSYRGLGLPLILIFQVIALARLTRPQRRSDVMVALEAAAAQLAPPVTRTRMRGHLLLTLAREGAATTTPGAAGVHAQSQGSPSTAELLVALGPKASWWGNGVFGAQVAGVVAIPLVLYDVVLQARNGGLWNYVTSIAGIVDGWLWIGWEVTQWLTIGFGLGALWSLLPGRRGVMKAVSFAAPLLLAWLADNVVTGLLDQGGWPPDWGRWGLEITVVGVTAAALDIASLRDLDANGWDLVSILRLRNTRWLPAYGLAVAAVLLNVAHVIQSGESMSSLPEAVLTTFVHPLTP